METEGYVVMLVFFMIGISLYLSSESWSSPSGIKEDYVDNSFNSSLSLIAFLTQYKVRIQKDYERPAESLKSSFYNVKGKINEDHAHLHYQFPLVNGLKKTVNVNLYPQEISKIVDSFGFDSTLDLNHQEFDKILYESSITYSKGNFLGVNYNAVISNTKDFSYPFSLQIIEELERMNIDTYFNRVQSALNFVQFLPYGVPNFDSNGFIYLGLALPPESFVLNYSDCDSKSVFFASILSNIIDIRNVILVTCLVSNLLEPAEFHMMVGVRGLHLSHGKHIHFENEDYLLLETTAPSKIGDWPWDSFELIEINRIDV
jgi:hypothetical protein